MPTTTEAKSDKDEAEADRREERHHEAIHRSAEASAGWTFTEFGLVHAWDWRLKRAPWTPCR